MFDNLCKSWPRESQQCINRLKNKQTSYRVLNTVLIKVLYERCGSWPQKCYGDGYSTGWLRHFIATRRYEFFNFRNAEARSAHFLYSGTGKIIQYFQKSKLVLKLTNDEHASVFVVVVVVVVGKTEQKKVFGFNGIIIVSS